MKTITTQNGEMAVERDSQGRITYTHFQRSQEAILADLRSVEGQLSPENLTCDGEASKAWVRKRGAELRKQRAALVRELGHEPTTKELYGY